MILLTQRIGQGPTRRCDKRCYDAKGGKCDCICGGRNHSAGIVKALEHVREMFAPAVLCQHGKILGACEHGCYVPAGRHTAESDKVKGTGIELTGRARRELRRREEARV